MTKKRKSDSSSNDKSDAKRTTEKQLKHDGYKYIEIVSVVQTKQTRKVNNVIYATNSKESNPSTPEAKIGLLHYGCCWIGNSYWNICAYWNRYCVR